VKKVERGKGEGENEEISVFGAAIHFQEKSM
jgi:hypothetical protein